MVVVYRLYFSLFVSQRHLKQLFLSTMTTYSIENAKSNRSACKLCKEKIEKDSLRIGSHSSRDDIIMSSWRHCHCFKLPKKIDFDTFVGMLDGYSELPDGQTDKIR